ncbi:hypothetical protein BH23BAC4_BH23BAC4_01960 [soil metagenome]
MICDAGTGRSVGGFVQLYSPEGTLYSDVGRPSIAPEMLLRATLLQAFFSVRSERQLMEQRWLGNA